MIYFIIILAVIFLIIGSIIVGFKVRESKYKKDNKPPTQAEILQKKSEERINKETQHFKQEIQRIQQLKPETNEEKQYIEEKQEKLEAKLKELPTKTEAYKVDANKAGFLYVVSNKSFSDDVYKIGLTRRAEYEKRVKELNNASVPFNFFVICTLFSEDVPELEKKIHTEFDKYRLNKVNKRKEFFKIPTRELLEQIIKKYDITATFKYEE